MSQINATAREQGILPALNKLDSRMSNWEMVNRHVEAVLAEASTRGVPPEAVASILIAEAIRILKTSRPVDDIRAELQFAIENLTDREYEFMRP